jgi:tetratricopeptide (TPR) repeat protein
MHRYLLIVAVLSVLSGCSSGKLDLTKSSTQLRVGVRAARDNLWREALFRFQRAVQIDPVNAMAQNNLAVAYEGIGEFEKAREAYAAALKLDRSNQYIQKNYSRFVEFYSKNKKREKTLEPKEELAKTAAVASESVTPPPVIGAPPPDPAEIPKVNPEPPAVPVTTPPGATKPDSPPGGMN